MKPFTKDTHGRNHYYHAPKEHKVPKSSNERRGTKSAMRQHLKAQTEQELT